MAGEQARQTLQHEGLERQAVSQRIAIGMGDDETAEHEEEVDRQVAARDQGRRSEHGMAVIEGDQHRGDAAQPVQRRIATNPC
jgi:hypothetical protein